MQGVSQLYLNADDCLAGGLEIGVGCEYLVIGALRQFPYTGAAASSLRMDKERKR